TAGINRPIRMAMMAITTSNSIKVKPFRRRSMMTDPPQQHGMRQRKLMAPQARTPEHAIVNSVATQKTREYKKSTPRLLKHERGTYLVAAGREWAQVERVTIPTFYPNTT